MKTVVNYVRQRKLSATRADIHLRNINIKNNHIHVTDLEHTC